MATALAADWVSDTLATAALGAGFREHQIFVGSISPGWYVLRLEDWIGRYVEGGINPDMLERAMGEPASAFVERLEEKLKQPVCYTPLRSSAKRADALRSEGRAAGGIDERPQG